MKRVLGSTVVWMVAMVVVASIALGQILPFDCFRIGRLGGSNSQLELCGEKLSRYFSAGEPADILLIGPSTFLYSAARSDEALRGQQARYDRSYVIDKISNYLHAQYFEKRLSENSQRPLRVANLGLAGGVISDQYCVFRKACASGMKPRIVICDISPREFLDPLAADPSGTPAYATIADLFCLGDFFDSAYCQDSVRNSWLGSWWRLYRERNLLRSILSNSIALLSGRSETLWLACRMSPDGRPLDDAWSRVIGHLTSRQPESKADFIHPNNLAADLKHYEYMYSFRDKKTIERQFAFLERLLADAQREKVSVCLVQMPLTRANLKLLPSDLATSIYSKSKALAEKYQAAYVQPDATHRFSDEDFEDSAHLNAVGGRKLYDSLASVTSQM